MALLDGRPAAHHVEQALEYAERYLPADAMNHAFCPCGEHSCEKGRQASARASLALSVLAAEIRSLRSVAVPTNEPDYRDALVKVMAHTGRTGADGHTHDLTLANGLLDSIARIANAALSGAVNG